jgi:GrpB-like predicted nucleotidyltransferase (UPF0157 family)
MIRNVSEVDEPISIADYDPLWPELFAAERDRVLSAMGDTVTRIEHFGSTAIAGMAGKPIVDLLVGVRDLQEASAGVPALEALGYENFGEIFIPGRLYLRRRGPPHFNVAITLDGGEFWNAQLMVRDYLRAHPAEASAYSAVKRATYADGAHLFSTYSQAKGPFLAALKERAQKWHEHRRAGEAAGSQ